MTWVDRGAGVALAAATLAALAWASSALMTAHGEPDALLRLAWSARPERVETCRQQGDEELARLPQHMRQAVVCEGTTAEYRLVVRHEGEIIADQVIHGGGLRHDRRLYVFREIRLPAGEAAIEVRFDRRDSAAVTTARESHDDDTDEHANEADERHRVQTVPARLSLEKRLRFVSRQVILVTYDADRQELVAVQRTP